MSNYFLTNIASSLANGSGGFSNVISPTSVSVATIELGANRGSTFTDSWGTTEVGVPNNSHWEGGSISIPIRVTTANSSIALSIRAERVSENGTLLEATPFTLEQNLTATGLRTLHIHNIVWSAGSATDRLRIVYRVRNTSTMGGQWGSVNIQVGTDAIITPITYVQEIPPATPTNFKSSQITHNSINLSWNSVQNATSYKLTNEITTLYEGPNTSFTVENLTPNTTYSFTLSAINAHGSSSTTNLTAKTLTVSSVGGAPIVTINHINKLKLSNASEHHMATVEFEFNQDVDEYRVAVLGTSPTTGTLVIAETDFIPKETPIEAYIYYSHLYQEGENQINIYGKNEIGEWTPYMDDGIRNPTEPPPDELLPAPQQVSVTEIRDGFGRWQRQIVWAEIPGATSVIVTTVNESTGFSITETSMFLTSYADISSVTQGDTLFYRIRGVKDGVEGHSTTYMHTVQNSSGGSGGLS